MADSLSGLQQTGDFLLIPNQALTVEQTQYTLLTPAAGDLVNMRADWYRPTPKKIPDEIAMGSDDGSTTLIKLKSTHLTGAW